jgi:DNA (cytosine-5)-methyltransferase 1
MNTKKPKAAVIDLFAGAGGFSVAAERARGDLRLSVELDSTCCETLAANFGPKHRVEQGDVSELSGRDLRRLAGLGRGDPLVVVGGPPCQPFSKASYWTDSGADARYRRARSRGESARKPKPITKAKQDDRRSLLQEFARLVVEAKADAFVMENVTSLLHPRNREMFGGVVKGLEGSGYLCRVVQAHATEYGVPQKRSRIFVLGSREELPDAPAKLYKSDAADEGDLPDPLSVAPFLAPYAGAKFYEEGERVEGRWAEHLREIPPGWNYKHHTAWAGHPKPTFEAETRFWNFLLKLNPRAPSWTINANPGPWVGPFHWSSRRLRTPELAALQTFPAGYKFQGSRRERVRQIGNAVPPTLAAPMIASVLATID